MQSTCVLERAHATVYSEQPAVLECGIEDLDHIVWVEPLNSFCDACDEIAKEIWLTHIVRPVPADALPPVEPPSYQNPLDSVKKVKTRKFTMKPKNCKETNQKLRDWIQRFQRPYVSREDKASAANAMGIPYSQITNFCNNYRKRYVKIGDIEQSYAQINTAVWGVKTSYL
jgi:hypothetical protein